jgi:hypothetical protein
MTIQEEIVQEFFKDWPAASTHAASNGIGNWLRAALARHRNVVLDEVVERLPKEITQYHLENPTLLPEFRKELIDKKIGWNAAIADTITIINNLKGE